MIRTATVLVLLLLTAEVRSETVEVKYRGTIDLKTFDCRDINRSSFIQRVCYDKAQSYMIIALNGTYYHYCELAHRFVDDRTLPNRRRDGTATAGAFRAPHPTSAVLGCAECEKAAP
jgi:hypothetical protein